MTDAVAKYRTLSDYVATHAGSPFAWGVRDCCMMAADVVRIMTGRDRGAPFRGLYDSQEGAEATLESIGREAGVARNLGLAPCERPFRDGDLAIKDGRKLVVLLFHRGQWLGINSTGWRVMTTLAGYNFYRP